jgi:multiple sugar transport system substrate-binding protein
MKKAKYLLAAILCLTIASAAWSGGSKESSSAAPGVKTVRVWTNDGGYEPYVRPIIDAYNAGEGKTKGIFIDYKIFGGDYHDVLNVALSANQGPEIYKFVGTVKEPYINSGWMVPINDMHGGIDFL